MHRLGDIIEAGNTEATSRYATEQEACAAFDAAVSDNCFLVEKEVVGRILQPRLAADQQVFRIDRLLIPRPKLGWTQGAIGIELKRGKSKLGKAVLQCLDYQRCAFKTKNGIDVLIGWCFLFGIDSIPKRDIESIMAQNQIGVCEIGNNGHLRFAGDSRCLIQNIGGEWYCQEPLSGRKAGSR